jgi:Mce-associated membrane protein
MSPKAKLGGTGDRSADSTASDPSDVVVPEGDTPSADVPPTRPSKQDEEPSPFDSAEFLEANRRNRDKMRAAAQARRAKEESRARRRGGRWWNRSGDSTPEPQGDIPEVGGAETGAAAVGGWKLPVLSLLLVVAVIAAGVFAYLYRDANSRADSADQVNRLRPGAIQLAGEYATALLTYDSANFAALDARITEISTPAFAKDFIEGSRQAREGSANAQAVAKAQVVSAGVISISSTEARVLLAIDQKVTAPETSAQFPDGIPYQSRVEVTLALGDGPPKLSDFKVI